MVNIPNNLVNGNTLTFGSQKYTYKDGKLTPFIVKQVGTELTSPKLNVETLTEFRHSVSGKPLYTKTIDCGFLPATKTVKVIRLSITDDYDYVKVLTDASHIVIPDVKDFSFSVLMPWYTLESQIGAYIEADSIVIGVGMGQSNKKAYVTVEYTKTADTSSSPVKSLYTGSLNELNLNQETHAGFRRNGKDVYMMEVDFGALPNNTTKSVAIPGYNATYKYWIDTSNSYILAPASNDTYQPMMAGVASLTHSVSIYLRASNILATTGIDRSTQSAIVVLKYIK